MVTGKGRSGSGMGRPLPASGATYSASGDLDEQPTTATLLEYYSTLSIHHRMMMIGFVTVYFGITQALLLTPLEPLLARITSHPEAFIASIVLFATFVLAASVTTNATGMLGAKFCGLNASTHALVAQPGTAAFNTAHGALAALVEAVGLPF